MKILLCADLHLASKMLSGFPSDKAAERRHELLLTFKNIIDYAKNNGISAIIIAGDLFDSNKVPAKTLDYVASCISDASDIDFFCIAGNHDKNSIRSLAERECDNLYTFGDSWTTHTRQNIAITGRDELSDQMYSELELSDDKFNIVVLHGQEKFSGNHTEDSVVIPLLENKSINCLALGHLHYFHKYLLGKSGIVCYPGCPEGRGFDECGEKGFAIIDTEKAPEECITFIEICRRRLWDICVDIDEKDISLMDFEKKLLSALETVPETDLVKITLCGSFFAEAQKDIPYLESLLEDRFFFAKIKDRTTLYIDLNDYIGDISLKGEFIRSISALDEDADFLRDVAECGIKALRGDDIE